MATKKKKKVVSYENMLEIDEYVHEGVSRTNIPRAGIAHYDTAEEQTKTYKFDPYISPSLEWAGKAEGLSFDIQTSSIHIHESIKPHKIIGSVQNIDDDRQISLFETKAERMKNRRESIEFYKHGIDWTNRLIAGDSLVIMNSLLEKEGMANQVQTVYIDPPYGIKYSSNFQPFINKKDVKDGKDEDLSQEPEMIKAFRDTWELGIHSYLTYLRNRLLLIRELLTESGSVFVQISDENVHLVRILCDEIFGPENYVSQINVKRPSMMFATKLLNNATYYIIWYAKDKEKIKYNQLFTDKDYQWFVDSAGSHARVEEPSGITRPITKEERNDMNKFMKKNPDFKLYRLLGTNAQGTEKRDAFVFDGKTFYPPSGTQWKYSYDGLEVLKNKNRLEIEKNSLSCKVYYDDYPIESTNSLWLQIGAPGNKLYVVQTNDEIAKRCILMTSDPGDLVLDITCGSGTTAYAAEQWGRRWITCDTSRVAIALAKKRLMTSTFDYYKLAHPKEGVGSGFIYKTAPHTTLGSIANNEPSAYETLYDQPEIDRSKIRISGPFTVEALPSPVVKSIDDVTTVKEEGSKLIEWCDELLATGILGRLGNKIEFSSVELLQGTKFLQAEAETKEDEPQRAVICFGSEVKPLDSRMVSLALDEVEQLRPKPKLVIFAAFQFDPQAANEIDETIFPGITLLKIQMNTDLMTDDLKKKRSSNQSFWLIGQPDVDLIKIEKGEHKNKYKIKVNGFDYYNVKKGTVESGNKNRIAMWMLDTDYDGLCVDPCQVFFPMDGKKDGWTKLAKTLKAEIDQELIEQYSGNESLPFDVKYDKQIAVKIIDDRGIESLKVIKVGGNSWL